MSFLILFIFLPFYSVQKNTFLLIITNVFSTNLPQQHTLSVLPSIIIDSLKKPSVPPFPIENEAPGNIKGGSITVPLTSCLTGLESVLRRLTIFCFYLQNRLIQTRSTVQ
jgi:hypothetical protein